MAQPLNAYQSWCLAIRNAIDADQPLPLPPGSPPLSATDRDLWQLAVKQGIHSGPPITPAQWLAQRDQRRDAPTSTSLWADVAAARLAAAVAATDGPGELSV
jgi:hypothetical protein